MSERVLSYGCRLLLGVIGTAALVAAVVVGATEFSIAYHWWPYWPAAAAGMVCALIAVGRILLLRGALRGRVVVRRPRPPRTAT